jgi:hypothetical protein
VARLFGDDGVVDGCKPVVEQIKRRRFEEDSCRSRRDLDDDVVRVLTHWGGGEICGRTIRPKADVEPDLAAEASARARANFGGE